MTTRTTASVLIVIALISIAALESVTITSQATLEPVSRLQTASNYARPALLQAHPDHEGLDCSIITERQFEPSRRAFVMKKVLVCQ